MSPTTSEPREATSIRTLNTAAGSVATEDHAVISPMVSSSAPTTTTTDGCFSNTVSRSTNATRYTSRSKPLIVAPTAPALNNGTTKLREFPQVPIPTAADERFADLQHQLKTELVKRITPMTAPSNVGWELKVVGITQASAVPAMVFTADKKVAKSIRQFFKEQHIREILEVGDPPIGVHVLSIPPPPLATNAPIGFRRFLQTDGPPKTLCGTLVKATLGEQSTYGTIGGVVDVDGTMYCTVAKHLLTALIQPPSTNEAHNPDSDNEHESSDSSDGFDLSELTWTNMSIDGCPPNEIPTTNYELPEFHVVGVDATTEDPGLDWAAIPLHTYEWLPNTLDKYSLGAGEAALANGTDSLEIRFSEQNAFKKCTSHPVILLSAHGIKVGTLEQKHAAVLLAHGSRFRKVLTLTVQKPSKLQSGDSGSWVVNSETGEVYGHLVTANAFGNGFVMPMRDVLHDMRHKFKTQGVKLPTSEKTNSTHTEEQAEETKSQSSQQTMTPSERAVVHDDDSTVLPGPRGTTSDRSVTSATDSTKLSRATMPTENRSCSTNPTSEGQTAALPPDSPVVRNLAGRVYGPPRTEALITVMKNQDKAHHPARRQNDNPFLENLTSSRDRQGTEIHKNSGRRDRQRGGITTSALEALRQSQTGDLITRWMSSLAEQSTPPNP